MITTTSQKSINHGAKYLPPHFAFKKVLSSLKTVLRSYFIKVAFLYHKTNLDGVVDDSFAVAVVVAAVVVVVVAWSIGVVVTPWHWNNFFSCRSSTLVSDSGNWDFYTWSWLCWLLYFWCSSTTAVAVVVVASVSAFVDIFGQPSEWANYSLGSWEHWATHTQCCSPQTTVWKNLYPVVGPSTPLWWGLWILPHLMRQPLACWTPLRKSTLESPLLTLKSSLKDFYCSQHVGVGVEKGVGGQSRPIPHWCLPAKKRNYWHDVCNRCFFFCRGLRSDHVRPWELSDPWIPERWGPPLIQLRTQWVQSGWWDVSQKSYF